MGNYGLEYILDSISNPSNMKIFMVSGNGINDCGMNYFIPKITNLKELHMLAFASIYKLLSFIYVI